MKRCGASTKSGKPCRNGWGCPHHKGHGNNAYINAMNAAMTPAEDPLFGLHDLTPEEIRIGKENVKKLRALLNKKPNTVSPCGCDGNGS